MKLKNKLAILAGLVLALATPGDIGRKTSLEGTVQREPVIVQAGKAELEENSYFANFPDKLPNATVEKYEVPGSKYCIVHFKQKHFAEYNPDEVKHPDLKALGHSLWLENYESINKSQKNLAVLLNYLHREKGYNKTLFAEGIGEGVDEKVLKDHYSFRLAKIGKALSLDTEQVVEKYPYAPGAIFPLALGMGWDLPPIEDSEANANAIAAGPSNTKEQETREDIAIRQIYEKNKGINFLLYGRGHSYRNNIDNWNATHPDEKFSLIVVDTNDQ